MMYILIIISHKKNVVKKDKSQTYEISCKDYRVATISSSYLTVIGVIIQSLKLIGLF